ncbi:MAG: sigma 54-interacting transcriptional regulator [Deltaproteobacteria bacterium]|nr:sigma 54-interacting transcriptional regulator [Deltaproteobacteria bacterium]
MDRILIVDDDLSMREFLELMLTREGYGVSLAASGQEALDLAAKTPVELVITDIRMKPMDGIDVLKRIKAIKPETIVILISAFATAETAVIAMNEGAFDFFPKPFQIEELKAVIKRALAHRTLEAEQRTLKENVEEGCHFESLVGRSPQMFKVYDLIRRAAQTPTNILITGESGTGKELVARAIHENSPRANEQFVTINCGGMPEQLIESELFGHKKGSFTGAMMDKPGLFEIANKGTIFLDEIGELSMPIQVKLLRVVQEKTYRTVGGTEERVVDIRLISATNKDLETEIMNGRFREDLYYRLNVINIKLPPLREREGDLPLLAHYFLEKYSRELAKKVWKISSYALDILSQYDFPGNVRELQNIIQRSVALEQSNIILPESLTLGSFNRKPDAGPGKSEALTDQGIKDLESLPVYEPDRFDLEAVLAGLEIRLLLQALMDASGIRQTAAELLGISRLTLRRRLVKYNLEDLTLPQIEERCLQAKAEAAQMPPGPLNPVWSPEGLDLDAVLQEAEKPLIEQALNKSGGSKTKAAEMLGLSLSSLIYRLSRNSR